MSILDCQTYLEGHPLPGVNQSVGQISSLLMQRGIDRGIVISRRAARLDPLTGNQILKSMLEQTKDMYGCLAAHVNRHDSSINAVRDLLSSRRFLAVMLTDDDPEKPLHPDIADDLLNACRRYQKPIFIQTPNAACVAVGLELARRYASHRFVFLSMGGHEWRTAIEAAQKASNVFLEISGTLDMTRIPAAIEGVGAHRLLFGSGMPTLDPAAVLGLLEDSEISPANRRRILHENADKLFRLDELED